MSRELTILERARALSVQSGPPAVGQLTRIPGGKRGAAGLKSFDAAQLSRLTGDWKVSRLSADAEAQGKLPILRSRGRDHEQNEPLAESLLKLHENYVVGDRGFTLQMKVVLSETVDPQTGARQITYDHAAGRAIEKAWTLFCQRENFLVTRDLHAIEACKLIERTRVRDGDLIIRKIKGAPNIFGFALQLLEADYLDDQFIEFRGVPCNCPNERRLPDGRPFPYCQSGRHEVRMGVELHGDWQFPVAYWLLANHPGDYFFGNQYATRRIRVPIEEIIHPFLHKRIGQTRGLPATVATMFRLQMLGGMSEAAIVKARAAATKLGIITKEVPDDYEGDVDAEGKTIPGTEFDPNALGGSGRTIEGAPGEFLELPMGFSVTPIDWKDTEGTYAPFVSSHQRDIAAGNGVATHALTGNLAEVNFSAARIGDTQQRRTFRGAQGSFIRDILDPIFPDWLEHAMLSGQVPLPFSRFADFVHPEAKVFHGMGFEYWDPEKDVAADLAAIEGGLDTRAASIARRGAGDFEQITAELAKEKQIRDAAGLTDIAPDGATAPQSGSGVPAAGPKNPAPRAPSSPSLKSAFLGDIALGNLPDDTQATIADFAAADPQARVLRYGMTVPELLAKADPHNLQTARHALRNLGVGEARKEVRGAKDKHILLVNDRIVDGHHHLAKAEKGKISRSLPVLDLTPLRYQAPPSVALKAAPAAVKSNDKHDALGRFAAATAAYEALRGQAEKVLPEFQSKLEEIASAHGAGVKLGKIKIGERAVAKIVFDYQGDASQLKDILRGTIVAKDREHAHAIAQHIAATYDTSAGPARNLWAPDAPALSSTGYRDAKFNLRIGGMTTEIQVSTPEMLAAKDEAHPIMEKTDAIRRRISDEKRLATPEEKEAIDGLLARQREIYARAG